MRIGIVGCGAVGSLFAANLATLDDVEVWAYDLNQAHVEAINAHGLRLSGAGEVQPEHLEVAAHCLWDAPEEQPRKAAEVVARVANPTGMRVNQLLLECEQLVAGCDVRNLSSAATAAAKLGEIDRALAGLKADPRVARARSHVREQVKKLKLASLEAV